MDFSNQLFENPPMGVDGVLAQVYQIFAAHWMPLVKITCLRILAISGTMAILAGFSFAVAMPYITILVNAIKNNMPANSRYLLDYSVGVCGASRLLDEDYYPYSYYTDDQIGDDALPKIDYDSDYGSLPFATAQELVIVETFAQPVDANLPANKELV